MLSAALAHARALQPVSSLHYPTAVVHFGPAQTQLQPTPRPSGCDPAAAAGVGLRAKVGLVVAERAKGHAKARDAGGDLKQRQGRGERKHTHRA